VKNPIQPKPVLKGGDGQPTQTPQKPSTSKTMSAIAQLTTLAWNLAFPIVGGVLLGHYLDRRFESDLTWTLSLLVLGVMIAFSNLYTLYREHGQQPQKKDQEGSDIKETHDEMD
jgi:predicted F0F1-ATPase subunit